MRARFLSSLAGAVMFATFVSCGSSNESLSASQGSETPPTPAESPPRESRKPPSHDSPAPPGWRDVKRDSYGMIRVPEGVQVVSVEHNVPYKWTAVLRFTIDTSTLLNELATMLKGLNFHVRPEMEQSGARPCLRGELNADGSGRCTTGGGIWAGGGSLVINIDRPSSTEPGTMRVERTFEHRCHSDSLGPPWPPKQGDGPC